jgi:hypothetical protein
MAEQTFEEKHAALIAQKVNAGLTREGAIEVIKHQKANDADRAAKAKRPAGNSAPASEK